MYLELAAAFVRGRRPDAPTLPPEALVAWGRQEGLRVHKFKLTTLPRVQRVLGWLRGLAPESLLDIGSGRGTFLWPLLDAFPAMPVTAVDLHPIRVRDLRAVREGGVSQLQVVHADASALSLPGALEGATLLEVLEHVDDPVAVLRAVFRHTRRFALVSVPSDPDDNPEHIRLFDAHTLEHTRGRRAQGPAGPRARTPPGAGLAGRALRIPCFRPISASFPAPRTWRAAAPRQETRTSRP
jgi:hypothetical protein